MYPLAHPAELDRRPRGKSAFRLAIASTALWALANAVLCHAVFENSIQPAPGPLPGNDWYILILVLFLPALLLSVGPGIALIAGVRYLRSLSLGGRWLAAWAGAITAGATVEILLLRAVVLYFLPGGQLPGSSPRQADNGPKELAFGFVATGVAMLAVMIVAARSARDD